MNGVAAFVGADPGPALGRMVAGLRHRGPTPRFVADPGGGVASCCRIHVASDLLVAGDMRLDDPNGLADRLGVAPCADEELVAHAFRRFGPACAELLRGDFAVLVWERASETLYAARDVFGVKPLYYRADGNSFRCASELRVLVDGSCTVDSVRVAQYLGGCTEDKERTFFAEVQRLPPATWLVRRGGSVRLHRYWRLEPGTPPRDRIAAFRERFTTAVATRLAGAPRPGAMLSGGLDSSAIVCVARRSTPDLPTFSVTFAGQDADERPFIRAVEPDGHEIEAATLDPVSEIERTLREHAEPMFAPNLFLHRGIYAAARNQGIATLFDGLDGDTTVSHGIGRLLELARRGRMVRLLAETRALARRHGVSAHRVLRRHVVGAWRRPAPSGRGLVARKLAQATDFEARRADFFEDRWRNARTERALHIASLERGIMPLALEIADCAAAHHGLDPRYPFFDRDLAELCVSLPARDKLRHGWTRWIMRRALAGVLPDAIQSRPGKADLSSHFLASFLPHLEQVVRSSRSLDAYVDRGRFAAMVGRLRVKPDSSDAARLWRVAVLAAWLRLYFQ